MEEAGREQTAEKIFLKTYAPAGKERGQKKSALDIWATVGTTFFLLAGYLFSWLIKIMSQLKMCESASRSIFSPGDCADVSYLIPSMIMTTAYGWSAMVILVFTVMRRWSGVGAMSGALMLVTLAHVGTAFAKKFLL